jgi:hypothetical protein
MLINCAAYENGTKLADVTIDRISDWGMNFEHMPELKWAFGYPAALGLIAAACGVLYLRFRRAGWL